MLSVTEAIEAIERLPEGSALAIDTETTGLDLYAGDVIRGVSVAFRDEHGDMQSGYFGVSHPGGSNMTEREKRGLVRALTRTRARYDFWNRNFDSASLAQIGVPVRDGEGRWYDGATAAWLQNENDPEKLKLQGEHWLGYDAGEEKRELDKVMKGYRAPDLYKRIRPGIRKGMTKIGHQWASERAAASKKTWATLTYDDIKFYAAKDTVLTLDMEELQHVDGWLAGALGTDPWPDMEREFRLTEVVYRIMDVGVRVDLGRSQELARRYNTRIAQIEEEFEGINLSSTKQLAKLVYDDWGLEPHSFTDSGAPSVDKEALEELQGYHDGIDVILEHRGLTKMVGTYLNPMSVWADSNDRIHTSLNVTGTVTGRFSSSHPNLQNIPKKSTDDTVKKLYVPSDGFELVEYDLHSAELYVGAAITGDLDMQAALLEPGRNFHEETADGVFGRHDEPFYTLAKNLNYGIPYGMQGKKYALYLVKALKKPMSEALIRQGQQAVKAHKRKWPITHRGIKKLTEFANENDYLPMIVPGRFRHFSGWTTHVPGFTAFNAAVQGGVAEIMKSWMIAVEPELAEFGARMVLQVHDSLWLEQPIGLTDRIERMMQEVLDGINPLSMRLTIDSKKLN